MVDGDSGSDRRRALEEKKRQLAEMRAAKNRNEEDRKRALLSNSNIQKPPQENGRFTINIFSFNFSIWK